MPDNDRPSPRTECGPRWFWAETLEELQGLIRYSYGRGHFIVHPRDTDVVHIGNTVPNDATDYDALNDEDNEEVTKPTLKFENTLYYTAPIFQGHGYYATRLPSRAMMYQHWREEKGGISISNEAHPASNDIEGLP